MRKPVLLPLALLALGLAAAGGFFAAAAVLSEGGGGESAALQLIFEKETGEGQAGDAGPLLSLAPGFAGLVLAEEPGGGGVRITEVLPGSPADDAGLKEGDIITAVDGEAVDTVTEVRTAIFYADPGDEMAFSVRRDGVEEHIAVTLGARPGFAGEPFEPPVDLRPEQMLRPYLGASLAEVTPEVQEELGLASGGGVAVMAVEEGGPAYGAGLRRSDVITAVDGLPVFALERIVPWPPFIPDVLAGKEPGDQVTFTVRRDGQEQNVTVVLGDWQRVPFDFDVPFREVVRPYLGASLAEVTVEIREELDLALGGGVAVVGVDKGGPAYAAGLRRGDVILMIGFKRVETAEEVQEAILEREPGEMVRLLIRRGFRELHLEVELGARRDLDALRDLPWGELPFREGLRSLLPDTSLDLDLDLNLTDLPELFERLVGVDVVVLDQRREHVKLHLTAGVLIEMGEDEIRIAPNGYSGIDRRFSVTEKTRVFSSAPEYGLEDLQPGDGVLVLTRDDSDEALAVLSPLFAWGRHRGVLPLPVTPEMLLPFPDVQ